MTVQPAKNISVAINCPWQKVYAYASDPENMVHWASGLAQERLTSRGDLWVASTPLGELKIKFAPKNTFGILDHEVFLPSGERVYSPLRVIENSEGSEVIFTLFRTPKMTEEEFQKDADLVLKDLETLKALLETN